MHVVPFLAVEVVRGADDGERCVPPVGTGPVADKVGFKQCLASGDGLRADLWHHLRGPVVRVGQAGDFRARKVVYRCDILLPTRGSTIVDDRIRNKLVASWILRVDI
jgi:hypothetical protein